MREVYPGGLFLGNAVDARNRALLYDERIAAVVDLAINEPAAQLGREIIYCRVPICDGLGNSDAFLEVAIRSVAMLVWREIRTLVASQAGVSRGPAIAAAALATLGELSPDQCLASLAHEGPHDVSTALWSSVKGIYETIQ